MYAADPAIGELTYTDYEPLTTMPIPAVLTGEEPASVDVIYSSFVTWIQGLDNVKELFGCALRDLRPVLGRWELRKIRFLVMSKFFASDPITELHVRS
jgi:hypothetical protein